jgi:hypothetical protein
MVAIMEDIFFLLFLLLVNATSVILTVNIPFSSTVWTHLLIQGFSLFVLFSTFEINRDTSKR